MVPQPTKLPVQMSVAAAVFAVFLPIVCIVAATALMRLFDVKNATPEQTKSEVEKLLSQANREVKMRRRVRAGAPSSAAQADYSHFAYLSKTSIKPPSA